MGENFKAFLIDPFAKKITEVEFDGGVKTIYGIIDCKIFDVAPFGRNGDGVFVDDFGMSREGQKVFKLKGHPYPLFGKGLVVGCDLSTGDTRNAVVTFEELKKLVVFESEKSQ